MKLVLSYREVGSPLKCHDRLTLRQVKDRQFYVNVERNPNLSGVWVTSDYTHTVYASHVATSEPQAYVQGNRDSDRKTPLQLTIFPISTRDRSRR
jgi:hypothetical protein